MEVLEKQQPRVTATASSGSSYHGAGFFRPSSRLFAAFSTQSVRSGRTFGYYGREEVDVLLAISKNPSRIAAYNRITEGKTGKNGEADSSEVRLFPGTRTVQ